MLKKLKYELGEIVKVNLEIDGVPLFHEDETFFIEAVVWTVDDEIYWNLTSNESGDKLVFLPEENIVKLEGKNIKEKRWN